MPKKIIFTLFLIAFFLFAVTQSFAGSPPGPPMGGGPPCWPPPCTVPLDGGISILIAAGAGLAGKKLFDSSRSKKSKPE